MIILDSVKIAISGEVQLHLIATSEDDPPPALGAMICGYEVTPGSTIISALDGVTYMYTEDEDAAGNVYPISGGTK